MLLVTRFLIDSVCDQISSRHSLLLRINIAATFLCALFGDVAPTAADQMCKVQKVKPQTLYHIGHSLTDRMADLLNFMVEQNTGKKVSYFYKSVPGAPLWKHWHDFPERGAKGNIRGADPITTMRSGDFDALVLTEQTGLDYLRTHPTRGSARNANLWVEEFLKFSQRPEPHVYLYTTWYSRNREGADTPVSIDTFLKEIVRRQPIWEEIAQSISEQHPDVPIEIIPGGLVLKELQEQVLDGSLTLPDGLSFRETFFKRNRPSRGGCDTRDHIHLDMAGIYAMALTHYSVIYNSCPIGLPSKIPYRNYKDGCVTADYISIDPDLALAIQNTVWKVVNEYPWSKF